MVFCCGSIESSLKFFQKGATDIMSILVQVVDSQCPGE